MIGVDCIMTEDIIKILLSIPCGKVATYGQVARLAGYPRAARQVVRILHTCSSRYQLPWHRIVNSKGEIALSIFNGADEQKALLIAEGVTFIAEFKVSLAIHLWTEE